MERSRFLAGLTLATLLSHARAEQLKLYMGFALGSLLDHGAVSPFQKFVEELEDKVFLNCTSNITWLEGTMGNLLPDNQTLDLGKRVLDPRGVYMCSGAQEKGISYTLQVYYRMCQNCVELDSATLTGIIVTDVLATLLLALGVYCFAGHETGRLSRAADTQALLRNDQLYQPLRDRNNAQYSHLGESWPRSR